MMNRRIESFQWVLLKAQRGDKRLYLLGGGTVKIEAMIAIASLTRPPFYFEAREYCDLHEIDDAESCEKVRLSMCSREYMARMKPWQDMVINLMAYGLPLSPEMEKMLKEVSAQIAEDLGLSLT